MRSHAVRLPQDWSRWPNNTWGIITFQFRGTEKKLLALLMRRKVSSSGDEAYSIAIESCADDLSCALLRDVVFAIQFLFSHKTYFPVLRPHEIARRMANATVAFGCEHTGAGEQWTRLVAMRLGAIYAVCHHSCCRFDTKRNNRNEMRLCRWDRAVFNTLPCSRMKKC